MANKKKKYTTKFKPYGVWVVVPDTSKAVTDSGIILDEATAKQAASNVCEVIACGPDCKFVKVGDIVMVDPSIQAMRVPLEAEKKGELEPHIMFGEHQILGKW